MSSASAAAEHANYQWRLPVFQSCCRARIRPGPTRALLQSTLQRRLSVPLLRGLDAGWSRATTTPATTSTLHNHLPTPPRTPSTPPHAHSPLPFTPFVVVASGGFICNHFVSRYCFRLIPKLSFCCPRSSHAGVTPHSAPRAWRIARRGEAFGMCPLLQSTGPCSLPRLSLRSST